MEWSAWKKKKKKKKKEEKKKEEGHQGLLGRFGRSIDGDRFVSSDIMGLTVPRLCKWMETSETNISFLNKKKDGKEEEEKKIEREKEGKELMFMSPTRIVIKESMRIWW